MKLAGCSAEVRDYGSKLTTDWVVMPAGAGAATPWSWFYTAREDVAALVSHFLKEEDLAKIVVERPYQAGKAQLHDFVEVHA